MDVLPDGLTAEQWLAPLTQHGLVPCSALSVLVVGSAARGWHNTRSDFDIYVITDRRYCSVTSNSVPVPLTPSHLSTELLYHQGRRWDVTYWMDSQVDEVFSKVSWEALSKGTLTEDTLGMPEELLLSRLGSCLPLLGQDWVERGCIRRAESAFHSFVVVRSLGAAEDAVEDALGQLEAGDLESATISARKAFGHVVDAVLESHGQYESHLPKWRPKRFKAANPDVMTFADYWRVETMQGYEVSDPGPWIKSVLTLCQDLAMRVATS